MLKLLRTLILRPLRRDLLRTALTILSVALGVAVVVAIDLAGDAAAGSFRSSMQALTGKTDLEITATGGIDERYMAMLAALPFDVHFAPLMEAQIVLPCGPSTARVSLFSPASRQRSIQHASFSHRILNKKRT